MQSILKGYTRNTRRCHFFNNKNENKKLEKLVPNLKDKMVYVLHIKNLNQPLKHGSKLKKVYQVIRSEHWMKPYIMLINKLRTDAKNEFEKDFLKFLNNVVFGKTTKNIKNHKNMKL